MKNYIFILYIIFLLASCSKKESNKNYIARVNNTFLSKKDLIEMINSEKGTVFDQNISKSLITKWVKEEILYEKAKKEHFDKDKSINKKLNNYFRSLVIDEYLKFHFQSNVTISNKEIEEFYNKNKESYKLENKALKISHVFVEDYNDAKTIKSILESYNIEDKKELYKKYTFETRIIQKGEIVKDLNSELFEKNTTSIVGPISSIYGFHIIEILKKYDINDYIPLSIVRDDIYKTIVQEKNKSEYIIYIDKIMSEADYEIKKEKLKGLIKNND